MYDELLKRLDIMAEGATPISRGRPYAIGDYWNVCEEAAAAIRSLRAKLDAVKPRPIEEAPRDGTEVWLLNKANDAYIKLRWSTHYSVFGLGGCWTDGFCTMGDKIDFDWFAYSLPTPTRAALEQKP